MCIRSSVFQVGPTVNLVSKIQKSSLWHFLQWALSLQMVTNHRTSMCEPIRKLNAPNHQSLACKWCLGEDVIRNTWDKFATTACPTEERWYATSRRYLCSEREDAVPKFDSSLRRMDLPQNDRKFYHPCSASSWRQSKLWTVQVISNLSAWWFCQEHHREKCVVSQLKCIYFSTRLVRACTDSKGKWIAHHTCVTYLWPFSPFVEGEIPEQQHMVMPAWPEA